MNKLFLAITLLAFVALAGCLDDDSEDYISAEEQLQIDIELIDEYLANNSINAEIHSSGLRYVIHDPGDGPSPTTDSTITVAYEGRLLSNEQIFDSSDSLTYPLNQLIAGWQIGVPLISEGGDITLYIPSGYGYGPYGSGNIPPNSNLIFDVELKNVE